MQTYMTSFTNSLSKTIDLIPKEQRAVLAVALVALSVVGYLANELIGLQKSQAAQAGLADSRIEQKSLTNEYGRVR